MGDLSEHFSRREFQYVGQRIEDVEIDGALADSLEMLRRDLGNTPLLIMQPGGGMRAIGKGSLHEEGRAADIRCPGVTLARLHEIALIQAPFRESGIGLYPQQGFIHVDVGREDPLRWVRVNGIYYYY